ncbi:hypothetical protein HC928_05515 [bacterium]|nr:hypothetical protein [bacterium]
MTAVVNLRHEYDDMQHGVAPANYLHLPTYDNTAPSLAHLQQGVKFIEEVAAQGGCVYVHCGVGVGRAPTLVAAYLVSSGMTPRDAWKTLREVRPFILPVRSQVRRVEEYARLYG